MVAKTADLSSLAEQYWFRTGEEDQAIMAKTAQRKFGMRLKEFRKAWKAGKFDDDRERHGTVIGLAMKLPEYWTE